MSLRTFLLIGLTLFATAPAVAQEPGPVSTSPQYVRPGDVVQLRIWREPDMSGQYVVDEAGTVVFPLVGEYQVLDDTPETLGARLLEDYRQYLRNPSIDITVLRRVRVIGAVNNPGLHLVDPTVTIADALAQAGGATPQGDQNKLRIIRNGEELALNIRTDQRIADSPIRSGDQIFVPERSWVSRNQGLLAATVSATASIIIALFIR